MDKTKPQRASKREQHANMQTKQKPDSPQPLKLTEEEDNLGLEDEILKEAEMIFEQDKEPPSKQQNLKTAQFTRQITEPFPDPIEDSKEGQYSADKLLEPKSGKYAKTVEAKQENLKKNLLLGVEKQRELEDGDQLLQQNSGLDNLKRSLFLGPSYAQTSTLFFLSRENLLRKGCINILQWRGFEIIVMLCIFLNSILLANYDHSKKASAKYNQILNHIELGFSGFFLLECIMKIIAMGFVWGKETYLKNYWNIMDFIIVVTGFLEFLGDIGMDFKVLRVMRVLKPLRSINAIKSMKMIVTTFFSSLPALFNVWVFLSFIFFLFGIFGLQIFIGSVYSACRQTYKPVNATYWPMVDVNSGPCDMQKPHLGCEVICGHPQDYGITLKDDFIDRRVTIQFGVSSFKHFIDSIITILHIMTCDNWSGMMFNVVDAGFYFSGYGMFMLVILLGTHFLVNLILAVIMQSFKILNEQEIEIAKLIRIKEDKIKKRNTIFLSQTGKQQTKNRFFDFIKLPGGLKKQQEDLSKSIKGINKPPFDLEEFQPMNSAQPSELRANQHKESPFLSFIETVQQERLKKEQEIKDKEIKEKAKKVTNVGYGFLRRANQINQAEEDVDETLKQNLAIQEEELIEKFRNEMNKAEVNQQQLKFRGRTNCIYRHAHTLVSSKYFSLFINICILSNTIVLGMDQHPIEKSTFVLLELINFIFSIIFCFEMIVKLIGLGFRGYVEDRYNVFDALIVMIGFVDVFVQAISNQRGGSVTSVFRAFRLFRAFKLAKNWQQLQNILRTIVKTLKDLSNFSVLMFLFIFIYSLLGMELFAYKVAFNAQNLTDLEHGTFPASTFNNFPEAFFSVFIVLGVDGWSTIYINHYRAVSSFSSTMYFISLLCFGQYILLKLFIAILLDNFDEESINTEVVKNLQKEKEKNKEKQETVFQRLRGQLRVWCRKKMGLQSKKRLSRSEMIDQGLQKRASYISPNSNAEANTYKREGRPLFIFNPYGFVIRRIKIMLASKVWQAFIIICIIISSVQLAMERPLDDPNGKKTKILTIIDLVLTIIFTFECVIQIISFGFLFNGEDSYLQNQWNIIDFVVVLVSVVSLFFVSVNLGFLKILRVLKVLRPLRVVSRNEGLKLSIQSLFMAIPSIIHVTLISVLFWFIFGIVGINFFKGKLFFCKFKNFPELQLEHKWDCLNQGAFWKEFDSNFDKMTNAFLTLFHISTTAGWAEAMYMGTSATEIDYEPIAMNTRYAGFYYVFLIVSTSFFIRNLFIGVVISTFNREKEKLYKDFLLTPSQKLWLTTKLMMMKTKPKVKYAIPQFFLRQLAYKLVFKKRFEAVVMVTIILNTLTMILVWYDQDEEISYGINMVNLFFMVVFALEALLKIMAMGIRYFQDGWNIFDFTIVCLSVGFFFLEDVFKVKLGVGGASAIIARSVKIGRLFKLFRKNKGLMIIFQTFIITLTSLANVGTLLLLFTFIYAILGIFLFQETLNVYPLNKYLGFNTLWAAMVTLYRAPTGENWHYIMNVLMQGEPTLDFQCIKSATYEDFVKNNHQPIACGSLYASIIYYVSYQIVVGSVFLNLFIAIILKGHEDSTTQHTKAFNQDSKEDFRDTWVIFDPLGYGFIPKSDLRNFLFALGGNMGWDDTFVNNKKLQAQFIAQIGLKAQNRQYLFQDVLEGLALRMIAMKKVNEKVTQKLQKQKRKEEILQDFSSQETEKSGKSKSDDQSSKLSSEQNQSSLPSQESKADAEIKKDITKKVMGYIGKQINVIRQVNDNTTSKTLIEINRLQKKKTQQFNKQNTQRKLNQSQKQDTHSTVRSDSDFPEDDMDDLSRQQTYNVKLNQNLNMDLKSNKDSKINDSNYERKQSYFNQQNSARHADDTQAGIINSLEASMKKKKSKKKKTVQNLQSTFKKQSMQGLTNIDRSKDEDGGDSFSKVENMELPEKFQMPDFEVSEGDQNHNLSRRKDSSKNQVIPSKQNNSSQRNEKINMKLKQQDFMDNTKEYVKDDESTERALLAQQLNQLLEEKEKSKKKKLGMEHDHYDVWQRNLVDEMQF